MSFFGSSIGSMLLASSPTHGMSRAASKISTRTEEESTSIKRIADVANPFATTLEGSEILVENEDVRAAFIRFMLRKGWVEGMVKRMKAAKSHGTQNVYDGEEK